MQTPQSRVFHCRENGAMVEVFYEQLNFEMLTESEAYGVSERGSNRLLAIYCRKCVLAGQRTLSVRQLACRFWRSARTLVRYIVPHMLRVRLPVPGDDLHERAAQLDV
ncbi:hypothetical protein ANCDUO_22555, partial [Ancylostoma duodenale]